MGIDFIERSKKTINAGYDRRRYDLAREGLFTQHPECARYAGRIKLRPGRRVEVGEDVLIEERDGRFFASRGMDVIGDFRNPPPALRAAVRDYGGAMPGWVESVMELSGAAEIVPCP